MSNLLHSRIVQENNYDILQELGNGGNDVVLGRDSRGGTAALKYLELAGQIDNQKAFMSEITVLSNLSHPCIVPFIGYFLDSKHHDKCSCIVTEFMPNDSLGAVYRRIREGDVIEGWDSTTKSKIAYGVAEGMAYIHRNNTFHHDLKPDNVFLDYNLEPKIADFGLSKFSSIEAQMQKSITSLNYMSPETLRGEAGITVFADVYSYGIFLLSLCIEREPTFDSADEIRAYKDAKKHILSGGRFRLPADSVPKCYKELIKSCWSSSLAKRLNFKEITEKIKKEKICFPGTDMDDFNKYIEKVAEKEDIPHGASIKTATRPATTVTRARKKYI